MNTLFLFNPENDLALGCNSPTYSAPRNAVELRRAGSVLPLWYAREGDMVLAEVMPPEDWFERMQKEFCLAPIAVPEADLRVARCSPWGWSPAARMRFVDAGMDGSVLPSADEIERIRLLSHRRLTIPILSGMQHKGLFRGSLPMELTDTASLPEILAASGNEGIFFKSPWSSSGRGVIPSKGMPVSAVLTQAGGMIRRQGSVMVEQAYCKKRDFAMLFRKQFDVPLEYVGLSLFDTSSQSYTGNILASEARLRAILAEDVDVDAADEVRDALLPLLDKNIGEDYAGYFGVDMMVVENPDGTRWIHPCVEINLRMTMGVVAHLFTRNYLMPGAEGRLTVAYGGSVSSSGYTADSGRLVSGSLPLIPPTGRFSIQVKV